MAKEAYYFSHDSNARHDPKIGAMRSVYGSEGYAWFWILVEMMRESEEYKLDMQGKYIFHAYAKQMDCECNAAEKFVQDCIHEFKLFSSDGEYFWSESLRRRMNLKQETSEKRRAAANKRWNKSTDDASAMQMHSNSIPNEMQGKESKVNKKESKVNENKKEYADYVFLTETEYSKLTELLGDDDRDQYFLRYASWLSGQSKRVQQNRSAYLTILNWHRDNDKKQIPFPNRQQPSKYEQKINKFNKMLAETEEKKNGTSGYYQTGTDPFG